VQGMHTQASARAYEACAVSVCARAACFPGRLGTRPALDTRLRPALAPALPLALPSPCPCPRPRSALAQPPPSPGAAPAHRRPGRGGSAAPTPVPSAAAPRIARLHYYCPIGSQLDATPSSVAFSIAGAPDVPRATCTFKERGINTFVRPPTVWRLTPLKPLTLRPRGICRPKVFTALVIRARTEPSLTGPGSTVD
jgi:hypothetical protein